MAASKERYHVTTSTLSEKSLFGVICRNKPWQAIHTSSTAPGTLHAGQPHLKLPVPTRGQGHLLNKTLQAIIFLQSPVIWRGRHVCVHGRKRRRRPCVSVSTWENYWKIREQEEIIIQYLEEKQVKLSPILKSWFAELGELDEIHTLGELDEILE